MKITSVRDQYFQVIMVYGKARSYLEQNMHHFLSLALIPSLNDPDKSIIMGAGKYFEPLIQEGIEGRCLEQYGEIFRKMDLRPQTDEPFPDECDLTVVVEFLRLGGCGYGFPTHRV